MIAVSLLIASLVSELDLATTIAYSSCEGSQVKAIENVSVTTVVCSVKIESFACVVASALGNLEIHLKFDKLKISETFKRKRFVNITSGDVFIIFRPNP
jgi:hypothetical protein